MNAHNPLVSPISRLRALQLAGATALTGLASSSMPARAAARPIKIGYVTPTTGPLAPLGEADDFVLKQVREALKDGIANSAGKVPVEILVKDSQSNPNRAAEAAGELILQDGSDLMVVGATPENSNPVCDQCELNGVPCISSTTPWQPWFFGRAGDPAKGFDWTYHYFWGIEDALIRVASRIPDVHDGRDESDRVLHARPRPAAFRPFRRRHRLSARHSRQRPSHDRLRQVECARPSSFSWDVGSVDEIGAGAVHMLGKGYDRGGGLSRHVLGSNLFHYVRDPWGQLQRIFGRHRLRPGRLRVEVRRPSTGRFVLRTGR
jgi:hypothetical protein